MKTVAVILAGGVSRRFGGEKLLAKVEGRAIMARVVDAVRGITSEVCISVAHENQWDSLREAVEGRVRVIVDNPNLGCVGPARGILSSLMEVDAESVLFVPGDIPWIDSASLGRFVQESAASSCDIGVPFLSIGIVEMLIQYHIRKATLEKVKKIAELRNQSMRPSDAIRGVTSTIFVHVGRITNNSLLFSNVNAPNGLDKPVSKERIETGRGENVRAAGGVKDLFWKAAEFRARREYAEAACCFEKEAAHYRRRGLAHMTLHSLVDCARCLEGAGRSSHETREDILELRRLLNISRVISTVSS